MRMRDIGKATTDSKTQKNIFEGMDIENNKVSVYKTLKQRPRTFNMVATDEWV